MSPDPEPPKAPHFFRRGFYLHGCWVMNHPFSVRSWEQQDFVRMFRLLKQLDYTTVLIWTTPETAPMPLSAEDAATLRGYRSVIGEAKAAGLECWIVYCPNVISKEEVRTLPWHERSLYASTQVVRLGDTATAKAYLEHRQSVLRLLDNADAFVVIDGDPGGYPGAPISEYLEILQNDQQAVPGKRVIPWLWSGWGRETGGSGGNFWSAPITPFLAASLEALKTRMTGAWELMPGRSHREGWANGRIPVAETEKAGLLARTTIMCYEAIEFEPSVPAAVLQFDLIRSVLKQEGRYAAAVKGVFGNAQQPVMVLPNLYFFARAAADPGYLDRSQAEILADFAHALGGDPAVLVPAWSCLRLALEELPADLPARVRALRLDTELARNIPGGPQRYLEIIAAQVQSRRQLLAAAAGTPGKTAAAACLAMGASALLDWWHVHRYVGYGRAGDPFQWEFIELGQVEVLRDLTKRCVAVNPGVIGEAARIIGRGVVITEATAGILLQQLALASAPFLPEAGASNGVAFVPLFDRQTLGGWHNPYPHGQAAVVDGEIHLSGSEPCCLVTERTYKNFVFEGEALLSPGETGGGFLFRAQARPGQVIGYMAGLESIGRNWSGGLFDQGRRGWFVCPNADDPASVAAFHRRAGGAFRRHDWNTCRIICQGRRLRIEINGVTVTEVEDAADDEGVIGIQHAAASGQPCRFRNLQIQELPS